ncbi:hypothetical protein B0T25DRAFT_249593 [Lasiosphaeria hispida]|uniref:Coiled-coil domain-containing protein 16 n=1 Tax=Lasiosphaeria hispida TaxID=260671 RepID=A0AAJ0HFE5_9PEZI|nr:hypothetical protein B0T25DRAFT_249593 [Lasiosphaeria hispida]
MADVRALLRQQRDARRITHQHAAYSDAGKLLCVVCHEHIKTESLWDTHIRAAGHRQRLHALQLKQAAAASSNGNGDGTAEEERNGDGGPSNKRKLDEDEEMTGQSPDEDAVRKKRSRPDMTLEDQGKRDDSKTGNGIKPLTPPFLRRQSSTPTVGVEMQIPSRPATPVAPRDGGSFSNSASGTSSATTPKTAPVGRSPLIPQDATVAQLPPQTSAPAPQPADTGSLAPVDELWAAFEADLVHGTAAAVSAKPPVIAGFANSDAVISAPAMSAAEVAAKSQDEEQEKRRALVDIQIEDEREDATRALETEFEIMEDLEARARKLRERREALRLQRGGEGGPSGSAVIASNPKTAKPVTLGKENAAAGALEDEEDDDDETEDDWVGFRFRA